MISFSMCFNHPYFLCGQLIVIIAVNWVAKNQQKTVSTLQGALLMMVLIVIMNPIINNHGWRYPDNGGSGGLWFFNGDRFGRFIIDFCDL